GAAPLLRTDNWGLDAAYLPTEITNAKYANANKMPLKTTLMMTLPYHIYPTQSISKIIITQFETDRIPEKHVENVNQLDELIVTSRFQPEIWKKSGCKIPIS